MKGDGIFANYPVDKPVHVHYEYGAEITLSEKSGSLSYSRQLLRLSYGPVSASTVWPMEVSVVGMTEEETSVNFSPSTSKFLRDQYYPRRAKGADTNELRDALRSLITHGNANTPLFRIMSRYLEGVDLLSQDLLGAKSFNVVPSAVRRLEDIASEPQIEEDGAGLAAVLFALTASRREYYYDGFHYGPIRHFRGANDALSKVLAYSKIVNDAILNIRVEPDAIENQLRIFLKVDYGEGPLELPFSLVSDGTAKWFTLVTAIVTSGAVFSIEELENFLHPLMQKEIVRIVRETFSADNANGFAIMTTHSETILNCVDPDEMVLVQMDHGRTTAKRPSNSEDIRREINETSFGAGYYYLAGAIE